MGRRGILHGGRVRALAAVAALLALVLAWPADGQVVCTGGGCGGGGAVTSPVTTDPVSATGVWTFDNAANTPVTLSDGAAGGTLCSVGVADTANSVCVGSSAVTGEGSSADANEGVLAFGNASADNTLTLLATASGVELNPTTGRLLTAAGTGTGRVSVGGVLCKGTGIATTGTTEEVLATCTIPANTLTADGQFIVVRMMGVSAANTNNKTVKVRVGGIGGTVVLTAGPTAWNNQVWAGNQRIVRLSATAAQAESNNAASVVYGAKGGTGIVNGANYLLDTGAVTWANANDLVITGTTPTAAGDLTVQTYSVEVMQ